MKHFPTERKESLKTRLKRWGFNFFPAYRRTGARLTFLSDDFHEVHVRLSLKWTTRNYVGSVFGGSIFGALDPIYMVQLINLLGKDYVVWDKSARIKFLKPVKSTVYARFLLKEQLIANIRKSVHKEGEHQLELEAYFEDRNGIRYAEVVQLLYIADRAYFVSKRREGTFPSQKQET